MFDEGEPVYIWKAPKGFEVYQDAVGKIEGKRNEEEDGERSYFVSFAELDPEYFLETELEPFQP